MTINRDVIAIDEDLDRLLGVALDDHEAVLVAAFADVLRVTRREAEAIAEAMIDAAENGRSVAGLARSDDRVRVALDAIRAAIDTALAQSLRRVRYTAEETTAQAVDGSRRMVAVQLPPRAEIRSSLVAADPGQVRAIVERTTERIVSQTLPLSAEAETVMRRELRRGVAVGENPRQVGRRMVRALEDGSDLALSRAMTIARTEMIDAHRAAAQATQDANADVLAGWEWVAHGDERLCPACLSMHGTRHELSEPGPLGHPNCRCARVPVTKTWAELGFRGMRERKPAGESRDDILNSLTDAQLRDMLGARGYAAWKAGDYPISEWAVRRENKGWRPSYQVRRPPGSS